MNNNSIHLHGQIGGPGGGKTGAESFIVDYCKKLGFNVLIIPEAATMLFSSGMSRDYYTQRNILDMQIWNENFYRRMAEQMRSKNGQPTLIYCDRGILDGYAYVKDENEFTQLLLERGLSKESVRQTRYDSITHLVTAADGASEFYTLENNRARTETLDEAIALDKKLQAIWLGGEHYDIITNRRPDGTQKTFEEKMHENARAIFTAMGYPTPVEKERRWRVPISFDFRAFANQLGVHSCNIHQTYLVGGTSLAEERVRMKSHNDGSVFFYHTLKTDLRIPQDRIEHNELIPDKKYHKLLLRKDLARKPVIKTRLSFIHQGFVFTLDGYQDGRDYYKLELEGAKVESDFVPIPDFLGEVVEVTDDPTYKESHQALINA